MATHLPHAWVFYGLLLGTTIVLFLIVQPFLSALVLALTLAIVFQPINNYLIGQLSGRRTIAAIITLIIVALVVILPLFWFGWQIFDQGRELYTAHFITTDEPTTNLGQIAAQARDYISSWLPGFDFDHTGIEQLQTEAIQWLVANFNVIFANTVRIAFNTLILFLALFFLFKDMPRLQAGLKRLSPLGAADHDQVMAKLKTTINSVVLGSLLIALLQGLAVALGFIIFGLPQPLFWGGIAVVLSLIPGLGPILILAPAAILLYLAGQIGSAIGILIWALLIVSLIDNLLRPILIERGIKIHPFLILVAALGGIGFFGPIGFVLGPIILSLFFALLDVYLNYQASLINQTN